MSQKKTKLCANCDGLVDLDVIICPYCGSDVLEVADSQSTYAPPHYRKNLSAEETLCSLYPPPYQPKNIETADPSDSSKEAAIEEEDFEKKKSKKFSSLLSTLFFSLGVNFFLFGLYLFVFSKNKELFLRFDASYWYLYFLVGGPLIFFGYKMLFSKEH